MFLNYLFLGLISALRPSADTLITYWQKCRNSPPICLFFAILTLGSYTKYVISCFFGSAGSPNYHFAITL